MTATARRYFLIALLSPTIFQAFSQDTRSFNQNASRSNHTRLGYQDNWNFSLSSGLSFAPKSNERNLFRGNGLATKISGDYYFGQIGLGLSAGMTTGSIGKDALNDFLIERKLQQGTTEISKSNPFNSYILLGPSFRMGQKVIFSADLRGGIMFNDPGAVSLSIPGMDRPAYAFQSGEKKTSPGFAAAIKIAYPINPSTSFFINTDYLQSKADIRLYDPQSGIDIPANRSRNVKLATVGIGLSRSFGATGREKKKTGNRKQLGNTTWSNRSTDTQDNGSTTQEELTGQLNRTIENGQPGNEKHAINTKGTGATNGRMANTQNCGPVTLKTTSPDGVVEERSFQCPADAAEYSRSVQQPENERMIHRDLAARNVISGRLSFVTGNSNGAGIITNKTITSTAKQTQGATFGEKVNMGVSAAGGGSSNVKKYGLIFADQGSSAYTSSLATVNENMNYRSSSITKNPLYEDKGNSGHNPMHQSRHNTNPLYEDKGNSGTNPVNKSAQGGTNPLFEESGNVGVNPLFEGKNDAKTNPLYTGNQTQGSNPLYNGKMNGTGGSDGIGFIGVELLDTENNVVVASTETNSEGEFFFANVPDGIYAVRVKGQIIIQKGYDLNATSNVDLLGVIEQADHQAVLTLNTNNTSESQQRAGISTSRSNIRTRSLSIIDADSDGDGQYESTRILMGLSDGTTIDVTANATVSKTASGKKVTVKGWDPEKKRVASGSEQQEYTINLSDEDIQLSKGNNEKLVAVDADIIRQNNIVQITVMVDDQKIKTKSNIKNDRLMNPNSDSNSSPITAEGQKIKTKSNIKNDRLVNPNNENDASPLTADGQKIKTKSNIKNDRLINPNNENNSPALSADGQKIKTKSNIKNDRLANPDDDDNTIDNGIRKLLPISNIDLNGDGQQEMIVGALVPGGGVVSSAAMRPGTPIGGIIVKGGKNPGGILQRVITNERGEFMFSNWSAGNYQIIIERQIIINDETVVSVGGNN